MPEHYKALATPRFPLVVRDGRPFGQGGIMKSLPWIYPSVFSGSLRTLVGNMYGSEFQGNELADFKQIATTGALPCIPSLNALYLPKPCDCVVSEREENGIKKRFAYAVRPGELRTNEGVDLPCGNQLKPAFLQRGEKEDNFKPTKSAPFWSWTNFMKWLETENATGELVGDDVRPQLKDEPQTKDALQDFKRDERTGVEIDSNSGLTTQSRLFSTVGLDLFMKGVGESISLFSQITSELDLPESYVGSIGGRRRLASWKFWNMATSENENVFPDVSAPETLKEKTKERGLVRMILATPAIFEKGWRPGWLNDDLIGAPKVCDGKVALKLESAVIDRWIPVSGWSYEQNAPKKVRRMVPEGAVYFFRVVEGDAGALFEDAWFRSVCDDAQDARDGFGVALWGAY